MGKRSDFERRPKERYFTWDQRAYPVLMAHLDPSIQTFAEPCAGGGNMVMALQERGLQCLYAGDIDPDEPDGPALCDIPILTSDYKDIDDMGFATADAIITNPPWKRSMLHPFIDWCVWTEKPAWLLIDSNWAFTAQARPYLKYCSMIAPTPRLKWIWDSDHAAKDDTSWYLFGPEPVDTIFVNVALDEANLPNDAHDLLS